MSLTLPRLGKPVSALRVAVWSDDPVAPVSKAVRQRVESVGAALREAGRDVDDAARPDFSSRASRTAFQFLLQATMSSRMPEADFHHSAALWRGSQPMTTAIAPRHCAPRRRRFETGAATTKRVRICAGRGMHSSTAMTCC